MPGALLNIKYNANGQRERTYNFAVKQIRGGNSTGPIDGAFVNDVFGPRVPNGDFSRTLPGFGGTDESVLEATIQFLRGLHPNEVTFNSVYLSDGVTPGPGTGNYAVTPLGLPGTYFYQLAPDPDQETLAPGTICMLLGKTPSSLSLRPGHLWLRYCLYDSAVTYGGRDDVAFDSPALKAQLSAIISGAVTASRLRAYFTGVDAPNGAVFFGQAQYYTKAEIAVNPGLKGALKVVQAIKDFKLLDAAPRQGTRGKRRTPTQAQIAAALASKGISLTSAQQSQLYAVPSNQDNGIKPAATTYPDEAAEAQGAEGTVIGPPPP